MLWLYRVLENDDEGDPLDWGIVSAADFAEGQRWVTAHLESILGEGDHWEVDVAFYPTVARPGPGVWASDAREVVTLTGRTPAE